VKVTRHPPNDGEFLARRRRLVKPGFWICLAGMFAFLGLGIWTWFRSRALVDPLFVAEQMEKGAADPATLQMLAVMAPLLFDALIGLGAILMLIAALALRTEGRYLDIIEKLRKDE
jgi:hypothetical protein